MTVKGKWSQHEIQTLEGFYLKIGQKGCAEKLDRTANSVGIQASKMGLTKEPRYTEKEIDYICKNYTLKGPLELSKEMNRSRIAIRNMAVRLGLKVCSETRKTIARGNRAKWTIGSEKARSEKMSKYKGCLSPSWKGGVCNVSEMIRGRLYAAWTKYIFQRDNHTCRLCGHRSKKLSAHHVRTFVQIRDRVIEQNPHLDLNNYEDRERIADLVIESHTLDDGITLCLSCHKKHHFENGVNCGDLLTDDAEDNPQPSPPKLELIVGGKVQRLTGEDTATDKPDTSAPLSKSLGQMR